MNKLYKKIKNGIKYVTDVEFRFAYNAVKGRYKSMSDEDYLKRLFKYRTGYELNLDQPKSFNEKLQWLKLYDRNPKYTILVDKFEVKEYIARTIGEKYIIPTLGVWENFEQIDFKKLPDKFVLKCTHDSGGVVVCKDKKNFSKEAAQKKINRCLQRNYYDCSREWPYKNIIPRIIAEECMEDDCTANELIDYKFMCFNGEVKCSFTCSGRFSEEGLHVTFFDREWNVMPFERYYPSVKEGLPMPINYLEMLELAEKLSQGIPFVRVDFYEIKGQTYFGEMTFYPGSGMEKFTPIEWDYVLGSWINLPNDM